LRERSKAIIRSEIDQYPDDLGIGRLPA